MTHYSMIVPGLLALGIAAVIAIIPAPVPAPSPAAADCVLTFEPASVVAGAEATEVMYDASEEIPAPDSVAFADESGLSGALAEEQPDHIVVESSQGVLGDWTVTLLQSEAPICEGILQVTENR